MREGARGFFVVVREEWYRRRWRERQGGGVWEVRTRVYRDVSEKVARDLSGNLEQGIRRLSRWRGSELVGYIYGGDGCGR